MEFTQDTLTMIWMGLLLAPPLIYGIWMQYKMAKIDGGEAYFKDRSDVEFKARRATFHLETNVRHSAQKVAGLKFDWDALTGAYGDEIKTMGWQAAKFLGIYIVYAAILIAVGAMWLG